MLNHSVKQLVDSSVKEVEDRRKRRYQPTSSASKSDMFDARRRPYVSEELGIQRRPYVSEESRIQRRPYVSEKSRIQRRPYVARYECSEPTETKQVIPQQPPCVTTNHLIAAAALSCACTLNALAQCCRPPPPQPVRYELEVTPSGVQTTLVYELPAHQLTFL